MEPPLILNLKPYKTTNVHVKYLKKVYHKGNMHVNISWNLRLPNMHKISSIQDYYLDFSIYGL